jgi:hypothetical protein
MPHRFTIVIFKNDMVVITRITHYVRSQRIMAVKVICTVGIGADHNRNFMLAQEAQKGRRRKCPSIMTSVYTTGV